MNHRKRVPQTFYILIVIVIGLASRRYTELQPAWLAAYSGDVLWGLMVYFMAGLLLPNQRMLYTALTAFAFSALIELSQLYHRPWIDTIRSYKLGGLILGYGFLWSDILCYAAGIALGVLIEWILYKRKL